MSSLEAARIVADGYDRLDGVYRDWVTQMLDGPRAGFLERILGLIPSGSDVLEIGCGPGTDAAALAAGRRYTGIDLSSVQLAHARTAVPTGTFLHDDVLHARLPAASLDAVVAFYALVHVPTDRTPELFERIAGWLRPGGLLCATFGTSDNPGDVQHAWLGVADMYFSSLSPERTEAALRESGFSILSAETITEEEDGEGPSAFHWVIARRADGGNR